VASEFADEVAYPDRVEGRLEAGDNSDGHEHKYCHLPSAAAHERPLSPCRHDPRHGNREHRHQDHHVYPIWEEHVIPAKDAPSTFDEDHIGGKLRGLKMTSHEREPR